MHLAKILFLLATVHLIAGQTTYTNFFSTRTSPHSFSYRPNYDLGRLNQNYVLEITIQVPGYAGSSFATFPPFYNSQLRVEDRLSGSTLVSCTRQPASSSQVFYSCTIPTTQEYILRFVYPNVPSLSSPTLEYFKLVLSYYDPNDISNKQTYRSVDVFRDRITRLIYINSNSLSRLYLFTLDQANSASSPTRNMKLYKMASSTSNNFFAAGGNPNLLNSGYLSGSKVVHNISLTSGYYILEVRFDDGFSNVGFTYQSDSYPCPYDTSFDDRFKNFQPCNSPQSPNTGLPCSQYNSITQKCQKCLEPYQLVSGKCQLNQTCPARHYINFGNCLPVNPLCKDFDFYTGRCTSCYQGFELDNFGNCNVINVTCGTRQYKVNNICYDVNPLCRTFNQTTGECTSCYAGYVRQGPNCIIKGTPNCTARQYPDGQICRDIPILCQVFDPNLRSCNKCIPGYSLKYSPIATPECVMAPCPSVRQVRRGGYCIDVSPLCDHFNNITGDCLNCTDPGHTVVNGTCSQTTSPLAGCQERQKLGYGPCVGPEWFCKFFNLVTMNCVQCIAGYFINFQGVCQVKTACQPGYWNDNGFCRALPPNCRQVDSAGQCTVCTDQIYTVEKGRCIYKQTCPAGQYLNNNGFCINGAPNCVFHNPSTGQCIECSVGYQMSGGRCCPTGTTFTNGACTSPQGFLNAQPSRQCKQSNPTTGECMQCHPGFEVDFRTMRSCVPI